MPRAFLFFFVFRHDEISDTDRHMDQTHLALAAITFGAAIVNGDYWAGLYSVESFALIPSILPSIAIGVPLGGYLIHRIRPEVFRRICLSFDAWVVSFGVSSLLRDLRFVETNAAYLFMAAVVVLDAVILSRFFAVQLPTALRAETLGTRVGDALETRARLAPAVAARTID